MKEIFIDLETTGLHPKRNGVWQLAAIVYDNNSKINTFNESFAPLPDDEIEEKAFEEAVITLEEVGELPPAHIAFKQFKSMLEVYIDPYNPNLKFVMYGYNVRFDSDFLRQWFYKQGDKYYGSWFWFPPIDVMNLAMAYLAGERKELENFKQGTVAKHLGIEVDESRLHDALYDIELTKKIYDIVSANAH